MSKAVTPTYDIRRHLVDFCRHLPRFLSCAVLFMTLSFGEAAEAIDNELTIGVGPGHSDLPGRGSQGQSGLGAGLYGEYRFDNFWGLTAGGFGSYQLSIKEEKETVGGVQILSAWLGGVFSLDVATYVPFVTLAGTFYNATPELEDDEGNAIDFGVKAGFGVDYRRYRHWSLGVEVNLHAFLSDLGNYPVFVTSLFRLNYHFEL